MDALYAKRQKQEAYLAELEAAEKAAAGKAAAGKAAAEQAALQARRERLSEVVSDMKKDGEKLDQLVDEIVRVFERLGERKTDALKLSKAMDLRNHFTQAWGTFPLCIQHRLRLAGFKQPVLFDDEKAILAQYLPDSQFALYLAGLSPRKN